jgi:hypothetical protein
LRKRAQFLRSWSASWAKEWKIKLREGGTPLVVKERVRKGVKRKEIKAFLLERNGATTKESGEW